MTNLITEMSKYFMIFMFAFYTYECFAAFRPKIKPEQRKHILSRQCAAVFLIHFDAFLVLYLVTEDITLWVFYAAQAVLLAVIQTCYQLFYSKSSRLLTNNLCMLLGLGFVMLTRLSADSARKQFFIAVASTVLSRVCTENVSVFCSMWDCGAASCSGGRFHKLRCEDFDFDCRDFLTAE